MLPQPNSSSIKDTIRELVFRCPLGEPKSSCPFAVLGLLTHASRESLINDLTNDDCVRLFDLAHECACPKDPRLTGDPRS